LEVLPLPLTSADTPRNAHTASHEIPVTLFKALFDHAADGLVVMNARRQVIYMNAAAMRLTGSDPATHLGMGCGTLFHCHDDERSTLESEGCYGRCVLATGEPVKDVEMSIVQQTGEVIPVAVTYSHIPGPDEPYLLMSIRDLSDRKRLENERRQREALQFTLEERERLARDLHDGAVQDIAYANMQLKLMLDDVREGRPPKESQLARVSEVLDKSLKGLREAIHDLTFRVEGNLVEHLRRTLIEFRTRSGVDVHFDADVSDLQVPQHVSNQLAKVVQEALHNVLKHAQATHVKLECRTVYSTNQRRPVAIQLVIQDDGIGFDPDSVPTEGHYGMKSMRDRCRLIGAVLKVESGRGLGTTIRIHVPLQ
jgi:PAS domain S-box-containing protein